MTWIKICGITNEEDALQAASLEIDALGFIFAPSPRRVDPSVVGADRQATPCLSPQGGGLCESGFF